jgi:hypothetical protein
MIGNFNQNNNPYSHIIGMGNTINQINGGGIVSIVGSTNSIASPHVVIGDGNTVVSNISSPGVLVADGMIQRQSGQFAVAKPLVNVINLADCALDSIISPFNTTLQVNYVDAGLDTIRPIGSTTPLMLGDGGLDIPI